ncbi:MAG: DUF3987 domain-containing protein [Cyanobacteria bacterium P01_H01_bin.21]
MSAILTKPNKVSNTQTHFTIGVNTQIRGKCDADKLSSPSAFKLEEHTMASLAEHIGKGHPWMPGQLGDGGRRKKSNVVRADVLAIDVDDGFSIAQAKKHSFIKEHCGLGIESHNSRIVSKKNPDGHDKYRLAFLLAAPIEGSELIEKCNQYLATLITVKGKPIADPACKDASRFYFGGKDRTPFILNEDVRLPESFVDDALAWHDINQAFDLLESQAKRQQWEETPHEDLIKLAADALSHIAPYSPGGNRYPELFAMIAGVLNDLGVEGEDLLRDWDAGQGEWGDGGFDRILRSVRDSQTKRKATLGTLFYLAKNEGWEFPPKTVKKDLDDPTLEDAINELLDRGPSQSEIELTVPDLADEYATGTYDIRRIIQTIQKEQDAIEALETVDIDALANAAETQLSLDKAFPKQLARAISTKCNSDRLDPIRPVQSVLPVFASQLGSRVCIVIKPAAHKAEEWREYPLVSCIDIGNPSENKSQCNRTMTSPLSEQQKELHREYLKERDLYNECCRIARRQGNELPPEPKKPPKLFVTKGTAEGIMKRISELPPRSGMLYICDELAGLLAGADQYKNGKGNFKNTLLTTMTSPMTGTEERSNSDNGEIVFNDHTLSISGSIQLSRIKHLFDPQYDESGLGSRFLCAYPDLPEDFAIWSETKVNIFNELDGLIRYLQDQGDPDSEPVRCTMNRAARRRFIKRYEAFRRTQQENRENNPGLAAFIGKCPGHLGRLILVSHWIACYYKEEDPGEITLVSFNRGAYLLDYYISQFRLLQIHVSGGDENYGKLHLYILEQLKRKPEVTDQLIRKRFNRGKKQGSKTSEYEVRQAFKVLADNGVGTLSTDGKSLITDQASAQIVPI